MYTIEGYNNQGEQVYYDAHKHEATINPMRATEMVDEDSAIRLANILNENFAANRILFYVPGVDMLKGTGIY